MNKSLHATRSIISFRSSVRVLPLVALGLAGFASQLHASAPIGNFTVGTASTAATTPVSDETIPLQATVQVSPPKITIQTFVPGTFTISRKDPSSNSWGTPVATGISLAANGTWSDPGPVAVGTMYEYQFVNTASTNTYYGIFPSGYILTGIQVDQTQPKGMFAVITANDLPGNMPTQYAQYKQDLVDDGWQVREIQVPRCPDNYSGTGNGAIGTVKVTSGGTTSIATGSKVYLTNPAGKEALCSVTVSAGAITAVSSSVSLGGVGVSGNAGSGFNAGDVLTMSGGSLTTGNTSYVTANVPVTPGPLNSVQLILGGTGYTNGQTVTLTGQTSLKTAQATLSVSSTGAITYFSIVSSQTGFSPYEPLTMSTPPSGSGIQTLLAYVYNGALNYVYIYGNDTGYTDGETGTLTDTKGFTAQVTLDVYNGHIDYASVNSSQSGFTNGETLTLSGTATGSNPPQFTAYVPAIGPLTSVTVPSGNGGTGYTNGALVQITGGTSPAQGTLNVTSGAVTGINITSGGAGFTQGGYLTLSPITSPAPSLSVLTLNNSNRGSPVAISAGGSGYSDNDTVTIKGNGSGATAIGSLIAPSGSITGVSVVLQNTGTAGFTTGETLTITPTLGGSGVVATVGAPLDNHLLIRSAVQAIYNTYPGQLKNIVMVGKVPCARSGINDGAGSDGHGNECPYGADAFYAEMLGTIGTDWTDLQDNSSGVYTDFNLPGDNQYDQQKISQINTGTGTGMVQLGFGRIDLSLGIYTEIPGEITYFTKLHNYKINDPSFQPGRYVCDRLTYANERETDLQSMPGVVGMQNIAFITGTQLPTVNADQDQDQVYTAQNGPFLFYFKGSGGPGPGVGGRAVFWTGMQSHWGYWYQASLVSSGANTMQERLADNNSFTLDFTWNIWGMRYIYHRMGMGMDAGDMMKQSINNQGWSTGPYTYDFDNTSNGDYSGSLYMNQMGDPAIRLFMFAPPTNLSVVGATGSPVLNWTASTEPTVTGYHVYRAANASAPFTRLTTTPVTGTTYTDTSVSSGSYVYMVRAVRLETTGGGTYFNASLGTTQSINLGATPAQVSIQTTSLSTIPWQTASSTILAATGGVPQYIWSYTGSLPAGMTLSSTGVLSGIPTAVGTFPITVKATDQTGLFATQSLAVTVTSDTSTVLYPEQATWTNAGATTTSYGTYEYNSIAGPVGQNETFQRYDLSGVNLYNGFQKATLYLYVTTATATTVYAPVQANLIADSADGWIANGISKFFTGVSSGGTGKTLFNCPNHGFITGTLISVAGLTGTGAPTTGPYAITVVDANDFTIPVTYSSSWAYDPALSNVATASVTYNTRPTTYDTNVPTVTASGSDTPGTWLQIDVTPYVQEVIKNNFANFTSKKMGLRLFSGTPGQTIQIGSLNSFGATWPYLVIQTTNAPNIAVNSPTQNPVSVNLGSSIYLNNTVTALPARAANLTMLWTQVSGPSTAAFTNSTSASTGVSFSKAGQYVVQLTANDGVAQSYQTFTINVLATSLAGPTDSMVLRLPFDEGTGTTTFDYSGVTPANNGTLSSTPSTNPLPTWSSSGRINGCLSFAATGQSVVVPDSTVNLLDGMTSKQIAISCWLNSAGFQPTGSTYNAVLCKRFGAFNHESYTMAFRGGNTASAALSWDIGGQGSTSATSFKTGQWYHVVMMFDGTTTTNNLSLYVNGYVDKILSTSAISAVPRYTNANVHVGAYDAADTLGFNGMIDEVRIYNRILTPAEIQALASATPSNLGPVITTSPTLAGAVGSPLALSATVVDNDAVGGALNYNWSQLTGPSTLTIASPTSLSTSTTPTAPGSYGLQLMANDGVITTYANVAATITGQTFANWASANIPQGDSTSQTAVTAHDGLNNLFKYALGLNPTTNYNPGAAGLPYVQVASVTSGSPAVTNNYLSMTFTGVATDVSYTVYATNDPTLPIGNWTQLYTHSSALSTAPGTITVQDTQAETASTKRFIKLIMTSP